MVGFNPEPINGRELSSFEYSEAGLLSGLATRAIIQPLDVLKIRFQVCFIYYKLDPYADLYFSFKKNL